MDLTERVIGIGGSVGGIQAVTTLLASLPTDFPAAILIVIHTSEESPGLLAQIFRRYSRLPVVGGAELPLEAGKVYVAIPGKHLIATPDKLHVTDGPRENRNRPAIDPMLRSLARAYQERAIGVVLSGYLDDGTAGLASIKQHGGIAVVQDPEDAQAPSMPLSALANIEVDHVVPLAQLAALLVRLVASPAPSRVEAPTIPPGNSGDRTQRSVYTCPQCHGTLWVIYSAGDVRFECRTGHTFSAAGVLDQTEASERALWAALRSLEEGAQLARRLMHRASEVKHAYGVERFRQRAEAAEGHIRVLHRMLYRGPVGDLPQKKDEPTQDLAS